jgi:hypothetical protein
LPETSPSGSTCLGFGSFPMAERGL